jgi:hypothetical protein
MCDPKDCRNPGSSPGKLFRLMTECTTIEAIDTREMQIRQKSKSESRIQTTHSKAAGNRGNMSGELFELTKECKSIEGMNTVQMQIR